ncbi:CynX/NimT family MFS transporter [Vagococcus fluvialis]|uniref:MFS transporter n=1 Tax=Vagococcus fluvialis TaxID=2738 RepID=UPI003D0AED75
MNKRYFIILVFALSLNLRPAITAVGPLLTVIKNDLQMNNISASLLTTLPVFFMGATSLLALFLSRKFGIEGALMVSLIAIFIALVGRLFVTNATTLILTALLAGIGIGIAGPLIIGLIKKYFPNEPSLMSFYSSAMVAGAAIASTFAQPLYQKFNHSWQIALSFWSIFALVAAILLLPLLKIESSTTETITPNRKEAASKNWWLMIFFSLMAAIFYSLTAWLAPYVQSIGFSKAQSGLLLSLFTLIQLPVSFIILRLVGTNAKTRNLLIGCGLAELIGLILLLVHVSPWISVIFLALGAGGLFPLALTLPLLTAKSSEEAISLSAFMQSGGFMVGSLGPLLFGVVSQNSNTFNLAWGLVLIFVLLMIASVTCIFSVKTSK